MNKIVIDKYEINNTKLNKKILLISDIHYASKKDKDVLDKIIISISSNYDYIVIPGDFIHSAKITDEDIFLEFLKKLADICPVVMSIGNHDVSIGPRSKRKYFLNEDLFNSIVNIKNIHLLDNSVYKHDGIRFIGLTLPLDYYTYHENRNYFMRFTNNTFKSVSDKSYNILLCHSPLFFEDPEKVKEVNLLSNVNLILSGHLHAGLVPRMFRKKLKGKGFVNPSHHLWPKRCYGMHLFDNKKIVISPGIRKFPTANFFKHFNPLFDIELVEIILK